MPAAVSTILFPEQFLPAIGGYKAEPLVGQLAVGDADDGSEQVSERRSWPLMHFTYRTTSLGVADVGTMRAFLYTCGSGFNNFTFYEPEAEKYLALPVGITDGTAAQVVAWRNISGFSSVTINGTPGAHTFTNEYVSPTKEDRFVQAGGPAAAGLAIVAIGAYARPRYICRMLTWRKFPFAGGGTEAEELHPVDGKPLLKTVFEFTFREKR